MKQRSLYVFETSHPIVPACYVIITLCLTMAAMQPVLIAVSLIGAFAANCCTRGVRPTLTGLRWQLPIIAIIALFNPLFSASGSTVLFYLGARAVYLESLAYGFAMGGLFVTSALWFMAGSHMLTFDKVMALFGNVAPVVALMISSTMRMIPRFVRRGHQILAVQGAQGVPTSGAVDTVKSRLRLSSVLMGWGMEDSLEMADAMRARGWGSAPRRTTYTRYRLRSRDIYALAALLFSGLLCCALAALACSQFLFYPVLSRLVVWWGYVPYAAWMLFPAAVHAVRSRRFA